MDDDRTTEELRAELSTLRRRLAELRPASAEPASVTRRTALTAWVAPVLVSLPVVQMACAPPEDEAPGVRAEPEVAPTMVVPTTVVPTTPQPAATESH